MKTSEIRKMTTEEIEAKIKETKEELWNLRFSASTGQLEKPHRIKSLRHDIARMKTVLNERKVSEQEEMMEKLKETKVGKVVSASMDKTIVVQIETYKNHPLYKKRVKYSKKYKAHDEENKAKVGDIVKIVACRPLSKTKRYELDSIVEEAIIL